MGDVIGNMNQQITLRQITGTSRDAAGAEVPATTDVGPIWAAVEFKPTGSNEEYLGSQTTAITAVSFTIRNNPARTVKATDIVIYRNRLYLVRSVLEKDSKCCFLLLETEQQGDNQTA